MLQQLQQQAQMQARLQQAATKAPSLSRSRPLVCLASRRNVQTADNPQSTAATTTSATPSSDEMQVVSVAVPVEPQIAPAQQQSQSSFGMVGVLAVAAVAAGFLFKKFRSNGDPFARDYMQSINTMQMDELDPDIIAAARARRSRERANHRLDLDEVELPENHPWATRKPVTAEQEAAIQARLQVRPRRAAPGDGRQGPPRTRQLGRE